jgi:hypothetical protein
MSIDFTTPGFTVPLSTDEQFFYDHAGYGYHPDRETPEEGRLRGARALVKAEREGKARGWFVEWEADPDPMWDDDVPRETTDYDQYLAILRDDDGNVLDSLGSIDLGPDQCLGYDYRPHSFTGTYPEPVRKTYDPYVRVVEAEMMDNALDGVTS